jgi:predicted transcriptional regulator
MKISLGQKQKIAAAYVSGQAIAKLCKVHGISESAFYRLRREDEAYQEAEGRLLEEAREHISQGLTQQAKEALQILREVMQTSADNLTTQEGPNGGKTVVRKIDPKILQEKRLAADSILSHWERLYAREQDQKRWEAENLLPDELDEDEELTDDEE